MGTALFAQDTTDLTAEQDSILDEVVKNSTIVELHVIDGDTIPMVMLPTIALTSRVFESYEQERMYNKTRKRVVKVYPYAKRAAELLLEIEKETSALNKKRHRKKYIKKLEKELKSQFEGKLKNLTVSEGKILVKIIERNTGKPMNTLIKEYRNPITATFWRTVSKGYGYELKQGYDPNDPKFPFLEEIILGLEAEGGEGVDGFSTEDL